MTDPKFDAFVKFGEMADTWGEQYADACGRLHSANRFRLRLVMALLEGIGPSRVLDVGCGSGEPLIAMLRRGYDAYGFDLAEPMIAQARANLVAAGLDAERVFLANMEHPPADRGEWDVVTALGSVYYARDFAGSMQRLARLVRPRGHFLFSLRNALFSLFSLNVYTQDFLLRTLIPTDALSPSLKEQVVEFLSSRLGDAGVQQQFKTVDDLKIRSRFDNPLTVQQEILDPIGFTLQGVYYYHYHAAPPAFEHIAPDEFRRISASMENPSDWRGAVMASAFVVHATAHG